MTIPAITAAPTDAPTTAGKGISRPEFGGTITQIVTLPQVPLRQDQIVQLVLLKLLQVILLKAQPVILSHTGMLHLSFETLQVISVLIHPLSVSQTSLVHALASSQLVIVATQFPLEGSHTLLVQASEAQVFGVCTQVSLMEQV